MVNNKYEPKQEWALVREFRERALARRLDRDGAILERHTKKLDMVPVGHAVAVQNQRGRFPKKWDKTGVVVENMDYDKVLVRMDGSRRLTTRNRRFVKKIVSPQDLPEQGIEQSPSAKGWTGDGYEEVPQVQEEVVDQDVVGQQAEQHGAEQDQTEVADSGISGESNHSEVTLTADNKDGAQPTQVVSPGYSSGRPKRTRRPNVRYNPQEYDLSKISARSQSQSRCNVYSLGVVSVQRK